MPDLFDAVQVGANPTLVATAFPSDYTFYPPYEPEQNISGVDYDRPVQAPTVFNVRPPYKSGYDNMADYDIATSMPAINLEREHPDMFYQAMANAYRGAPSRFDNYPGMIHAPTMDLENTPPIRNEDGSISTVRSSAVVFPNGNVFMYPTCYNGECHSDEEALQRAADTGINMGEFRVLDENGEPDENAAIDRADDFAVDVHNYHDSKYPNGTMPGITGSDLLDAVRAAAMLSNPAGALLLYNYINGLRGE